MNAPSQSQPDSNLAIETYPPSWFDRLQDLVDRLPIPYWITYALFGLAIFGLEELIRVADLQLRDQPIQPIIILDIFQIAYVLTLMHFLDRLSAKSFEVVRPLLKLGEADSAALKARLTTMPPAMPTRVALLVLATFSVMAALLFTHSVDLEGLSMTVMTDAFSSSLLGVVNFIDFTLLWVVNAIFIYHTIHQLRTISTILTQHSRINLFHQGELYAFSRVSAATAIGLVLTSPLWLLLDRGLITLFINISFSVLAVVIFVTPLVGAHSLLRRQKDQLLRQSMRNKEALIVNLFNGLEQGKLKDVQLIEKALSGLDKAHSDIKKISTWPWQMDTARQIVGAISLPITIWLIQFALSGVLSP